MSVSYTAMQGKLWSTNQMAEPFNNLINENSLLKVYDQTMTSKKRKEEDLRVSSHNKNTDEPKD